MCHPLHSLHAIAFSYLGQQNLFAVQPFHLHSHWYSQPISLRFPFVLPLPFIFPHLDTSTTQHLLLVCHDHLFFSILSHHCSWLCHSTKVTHVVSSSAHPSDYHSILCPCSHRNQGKETPNHARRHIPTSHTHSVLLPALTSFLKNNTSLHLLSTFVRWVATRLIHVQHFFMFSPKSRLHVANSLQLHSHNDLQTTWVASHIITSVTQVQRCSEKVFQICKL